MSPQNWKDVIDTNLSGVFYTSQTFFKTVAKKKMKEGAGRIVNIASVVGQVGNPGQAWVLRDVVAIYVHLLNNAFISATTPQLREV